LFNWASFRYASNLPKHWTLFLSSSPSFLVQWGRVELNLDVRNMFCWLTYWTLLEMLNQIQQMPALGNDSDIGYAKQAPLSAAHQI
jgi:hypothetical protein